MSGRRFFCRSFHHPKPNLGDSFLSSYRDLYRAGFRPFNLDPNTEAYRNHAALAQKLIAQDGLRSFLGYLQEGVYFVNFWTAIFALEAGSSDVGKQLDTAAPPHIVAACLDIVARHIAQLPTNDPARAAAARWLESTGNQPHRAVGTR